MTTWRKLGLLSAAAAAFCVLVAGTASAQQESLYDEIKKRGVLKAGVKLDYPPIGNLDKDGKPYGWGIDMAKAIADRMGVKIEYIQTLSKTRIPLIQKGTIDAEFNGATPSSKREEVVDFTIPWGWETIGTLFRKGESTDVKNLVPPKVVALVQGSIFVDHFKAAVPNANVKLFQEYTDAALAVANKQADCLITGKYTAVSFAKQNPALEVGPDFTRDPISIALRQNDSKWRNFLNHSIQELWLDGTYKKLWEQHWGYPPDFKMWSEFGLQPGIGQK
ncbi:MAG: amino acid ABC transporter substrate-binding protein [Rhodospirillales bacterium]|nr:amino acid ABC transporter substrate-binding protein [Rhodospirillales bacterium]